MDRTTTVELGRILSYESPRGRSAPWAVRVTRDGEISIATFTGKNAKAQALAFYGSVGW